MRGSADGGAEEEAGKESPLSPRAGDGLRGCADRVLLGLIPSSRQGWPLAAACLKPTGGWLHVHDNVHEDAVRLVELSDDPGLSRPNEQ